VLHSGSPLGCGKAENLPFPALDTWFFIEEQNRNFLRECLRCSIYARAVGEEERGIAARL
jgi:hypothetical protein